MVGAQPQKVSNLVLEKTVNCKESSFFFWMTKLIPKLDTFNDLIITIESNFELENLEFILEFL